MITTILHFLGVASLVALCYVIAGALAWTFTAVVKPVIDAKPFNCAPCLSFWLTWVFCLIAALLTRGHYIALTDNGLAYVLGVTGAGVLAGLINYLVFKSQFKVYG
jgi:hypothetical protein